MRILCDVDGVLADFVAAVCRNLKGDLDPEDFKEPSMLDAMDQEDKKRFELLSKRDGFCSTIRPYPGAKSFLKMLEDVHIVTKPWNSPTWSWERSRWLEEHFGIDKSKIIFTGLKHMVHGDVLIEDNADNLNQWSEENPRGAGILLDRPWNRDHPLLEGSIRVKTYDEALVVIKFQKKWMRSK